MQRPDDGKEEKQSKSVRFQHPELRSFSLHAEAILVTSTLSADSKTETVSSQMIRFFVLEGMTCCSIVYGIKVEKHLRLSFSCHHHNGVVVDRPSCHLCRLVVKLGVWICAELSSPCSQQELALHERRSYHSKQRRRPRRTWYVRVVIGVRCQRPLHRCSLSQI